jgi:ADP-ribosylglycohydrolase
MNMRNKPNRNDEVNNLNHSLPIRSIIESLAVGDAMGMPTEFMTRSEIREEFEEITGLVDTSRSKNHSNLMRAQVTDDTEQNLYLIKAYAKGRKVSVENTATALLQWIKETDAIGKKYIGPSSMKALLSIEEGKDPYTAGIFGTTCGGIMRTASLVLCSDLSKEMVEQNIYRGCVPTHHSSQALEAAMAYGFALRSAMLGQEFDAIIEEAIEGGSIGLNKVDYIGCASSSVSRIIDLKSRMKHITGDDELLDLLYGVYGTGLESSDVCAAVFGIFMYVKEDVYRGIRLASSVGGDTDTIACLVGALCSAYAKGHNIPEEIVEEVLETNHIEINEILESVHQFIRNDSASV